MAGVTIGLLGGFSASVDGVAVADGAWRLKKARELVKLLALADGHRLHREQVMDALWRELDPAAAANNLNQAVHVARRALGGAALEGHDGLILLVAEVDVDRFEEAASAARQARTAAAYRVALAAYGGELLPENRYDDFAERRRDELDDLRDALALELEPLQAAAAPHRLPAATSSFVGRRRELAELPALLRRTRVLTLAGTGGAGKTRLSLELAREEQARFCDGAALVELAPVGDPELVPDAVAAALELRALTGQQVLDALTDFAAERELLLVFDNCEHLLAATAELVDALLRAAPRLTVLATSREPLRLPGEIVFRVPSLGIPDPDQLPPLAALRAYESVDLFVERATSVVPGFELGENNAADVARICLRLDGLPLALELAAGRVASLGTAAIAARLDDRFRLLRTGSTAAPTRQQTLEATLRWSHDLLEPDERVLFRRLAVFAGGFELSSVEAVCGGGELAPADVADVLGRLVEKSLVAAEERGSERRYRLLETVRLYAQEQLAAAGEGPALAGRHAYWALALAQASPESQALDREAANLRAALDHLQAVAPDDALRLCSVLAPFWLRRIDLEEARRRFADAFAAAREASVLRVDALLAASAIELRSGRMADGLDRAELALDAALALEDRQAEWRARQRLADFAVAWDDGGEALRRSEQALVLARRERSAVREAIGVCTCGAAHWLLGQPEQAEALLSRSIELFRALPADERVPSPLNIADLRWRGVPGLIGPRLLFEETLHPFLELPRDAAIGHVLLNRAGIARMSDDLVRARELVDAAEEVFMELPEESGLAAALVRRAYLELTAGDLGAARAALDLSPMRQVRVNVEAGIAHVGSGAVWGDVDHETQAHGLATTGGLVSSTGVGGFTLGGGIGWLMRKHGLACDNLVGADVVTADGQLVRASESENPELLWGLRGGGGNFGIVTQFDLRVHPVGPVVNAGAIFFPAEAAVPMLKLFREWAPGAPDDVTALLNLTTCAAAAGDPGGLARGEGRDPHGHLRRVA